MTSPKPKLASVLIVTDLEPDDYVAIHLLITSGSLKLNDLHFLVTGWKDVRLKCAHLGEYLVQTWGPSESEIFQGMSSEHHHALPPFEELEPNRVYPTLSDEREYNRIICLAPPRELFQRKSDYSQTELWQYGSFNVRSLLNGGFFTPEQLQEFIGRFSKVVWYESFWASGEENSVRDPQILETLPAFIKNHIRWWNDNICQKLSRAKNGSTEDEQKKLLASVTDNEQNTRRNKILTSIKAHPGQFVNADSGLAATSR